MIYFVIKLSGFYVKRFQHPSNESAENTTAHFVLPVYFNYAMLACSWFIVQSLIYFASETTQKPSNLLKIFQFLATAFCALVDNFIVWLACFKRLEKRSIILAALTSMAIGVAFFVYLVIEMNKKKKLTFFRLFHNLDVNAV